LPGSNGEVSYTECATTAKKDGYTIYWGAHPGFLTLPLTKESCKYKLEDIQPVARIATDPNIFIVNGNSEFNTLEDIVNYAKANPGKLTVGIGALNADDDLAAQQFIDAAGIEVNKIVYADGTTDRVTACMGNHIQVCVLNASEVSTYLGQVKILGVMAPERLDFISDVPTFKERGYEVYNSSDRGVIMPIGVDEAIVKKLSEAIGKAMEDPACQETMANLNLIPAYLNYEDFEADLYRMRDVYTEIVGASAS
ncbi:MAG: tripartite tricarboxylate transporter substrate binding protein, partial [Oscillospiraceae bacterium]|nr:tripartite tricarboxylate transporter substrate binding protein [Oscillospiraceae bacterium]